jgi:nitrogen fixation NifU-like protein
VRRQHADILKFHEGRVIKSTYMTDGCASSNICGSFAADMAMGKCPDEIMRSQERL